MLFVALPFSLLISLLARPIVVGLFGDGFAGAATALAILVWCSPLAAFNILLVGVLRGAGRERWLVISAVVGALFNLAVNLWAIPTFGIAGAAATTIATEVVVCGFLVAVAVNGGVVARPRLPYAGFLLALAALTAAQLATRWQPLLVTAAAALSAYVAVAALTRVVGRADTAVLRQMPGSR